jgi:hypothetical protein
MSKLIKGIGILALGAFLLFETLNFTGYCYGQGRWLSDEEFIGVAVARHVAGSNAVASKLEAECCHLYRWPHSNLAPHWETFLTRLFAWYVVEVGIVSDRHESMTFISACGEVIDHYSIDR